MSDLSLATREAFIATFRPQVLRAQPFYEKLMSKNKVTFSGGKSITRLVTYDDLESLVQSYTANETLVDEAKEVLAQPEFTWKRFQIPLRYEADWEIQNANAGTDVQKMDLIKMLTTMGQDASKLRMTSDCFNGGSTTPRSDGSKDFQSLISALNHDSTYGTLARTISTNVRNWWQGADPAGLTVAISSSSQDTATNLSENNLRKWIYETDVYHYMKDPSNLEVLMCPTLFNKLRAEMESKVIYKQVDGGGVMKQGFQEMMLDGNITIRSDPYLQTTSTMQKWVFILNMNEFELRISNARNFKMTDFIWQGGQTNGVDYYLARILVVGNLCCWKPNSSLWVSEVS